MPKKKLPPLHNCILRLTLSATAYQLAIARNAKPIVGFAAATKRPDGKIDVPVRAHAMNLLRQLAEPGENLSDTLIRVLSASKKEGV